MLADYRRNPLFHHTLDQVEVESPDLLKAEAYRVAALNGLNRLF